MSRSDGPDWTVHRTVEQMKNPFLNDGYLMLHASLNKLPILCADDTAKARCSSKAIHRTVCAYLHEQGIEGGADWQERFVDCLNAPESAASARELIAQVASDIGSIFWTLKSGRAQCAREDWSEEHWAYWRGIRRFYLAGGLLHGPVGPVLTGAVRDDLAAHGLSKVELCLTAHPAVISLIGAAKYAAFLGRNAVVFDFGHSYIKRGYVLRESEGFVVHACMRRPSQWTQWECESVQAERQAAQALTDLIEHTVLDMIGHAAQTQGVVCDTAVISVANYVQAGCFVPRGGYGKLRHEPQPYDRYLSERIAARTGKPFSVHLLHDGTAGAYGAQGASWQEEAFVGFGTSLSVGFPCEKMAFPFSYRVEYE